MKTEVSNERFTKIIGITEADKKKLVTKLESDGYKESAGFVVIPEGLKLAGKTERDAKGKVLQVAFLMHEKKSCFFGVNVLSANVIQSNETEAITYSNFVASANDQQITLMNKYPTSDVTMESVGYNSASNGNQRRSLVKVTGIAG